MKPEAEKPTYILHLPLFTVLWLYYVLSLSIDRFIIYLYTRSSYLYHVIIGPPATCHSFLIPQLGSNSQDLFSLPRIIPAVLPSNHSRPADTSHPSFSFFLFFFLYFTSIPRSFCVRAS